MCTIVSMWVTFRGLSGICAKYENLGGGNNAERGTEGENGWVRSTHFSSVCGAVLGGRSNHPRQPVRPLAVGLSHIFDPLLANYQAYPSFRGTPNAKSRDGARTSFLPVLALS